jgi:hypothetical protein
MNFATVLRKTTTAVTRPIAAARGAGYHMAQRKGRRHLISVGLQDEVRRVEEKCAATGAFPPNYAELWHLYRDVTDRRPRVIFEFGSGLSTNVMAAALKANEERSRISGTLYSFESERRWYDATDQWLRPATKSYVQLVYSPVRVEELFGEKVFKYTNIPDVAPDMVYLDGPALTPDVRSAADMLDLEPRLKPGFWLVIDGRRDNARFLEAHFRHRYARVVRTGFLGGSYLQRCYELTHKVNE